MTPTDPDHGIDLTRSAGWYLHVVGWRQLVMLVAGLLACYLFGFYMGVMR